MNRLFSTNLILPSCMLLAGCAEYGGGAVLVPEVTVLPAELTADSSDAGTEVVSATEGGAAPSAGSGSGPGTLAGRVVLVGSFNALPPLIAMGSDVKDKEVCSKFDVPDERVVLGEANGVANVFVYLQKAPKGTVFDASGQELVFDQQYCRFKPHCMIVPTGATLKVLSDDTVAHNTHSYPNKNNGVNSGVAPGDRDGNLRIKYTRAESEPISVKCDYHAWMEAYHLPIDHPFAAVTDKDGKFEISNLPAGDYSFVVWHEAAAGKFVERKLPVTITAGNTTPAEIEYDVSKLDPKVTNN